MRLLHHSLSYLQASGVTTDNLNTVTPLASMKSPPASTARPRECSWPRCASPSVRRCIGLPSSWPARPWATYTHCVGRPLTLCGWAVSGFGLLAFVLFSNFLNIFKSLQSSKFCTKLNWTQKNVKQILLDIYWSTLGSKNMKQIYLASGMSINV
jgi:hypothetical protein